MLGIMRARCLKPGGGISWPAGWLGRTRRPSVWSRSAAVNVVRRICPFATGHADRFVRTAGVAHQSSGFGTDRPVSSCGNRPCSRTVRFFGRPGGGQYQLRSKATGEDGQEELLTGVVDLPKDGYNGILITLSKNLQKGVDEMVSILAFTPVPHVIKV
jgi:hypothetical protein